MISPQTNPIRYFEPKDLKLSAVVISLFRSIISELIEWAKEPQISTTSPNNPVILATLVIERYLFFVVIYLFDAIAENGQVYE